MSIFTWFSPQSVCGLDDVGKISCEPPNDPVRVIPIKNLVILQNRSCTHIVCFVLKIFVNKAAPPSDGGVVCDGEAVDIPEAVSIDMAATNDLVCIIRALTCHLSEIF